MIGVAATVTLLAAACGDDSAGGGQTAADVEGIVWTLDELDGEPVESGVQVTLEFDGTQIAGTGGCNQYNGAASFDDGVVEIAPEIVSTMMACIGPEAEVESNYLALLPSADGFSVDDDTLTLTDADGEPILVYRSTS